MGAGVKNVQLTEEQLQALKRLAEKEIESLRDAGEDAEFMGALLLALEWQS